MVQGVNNDLTLDNGSQMVWREVLVGVDDNKQINDIVASNLLRPQKTGQNQFGVGESWKLINKEKIESVGNVLAENPHCGSVDAEAHVTGGVLWS